MSEETASFRRLDEPSKPLWGLSIKSLAVIFAVLLAGWCLVQLGMPPIGVAVILAAIGPPPVMLSIFSDQQAVNPALEVVAAIRSLRYTEGDALGEQSGGGVVLSDLPDSPVSDTIEPATELWEMS